MHRLVKAEENGLIFRNIKLIPLLANKRFPTPVKVTGNYINDIRFYLHHKIYNNLELRCIHLGTPSIFSRNSNIYTYLQRICTLHNEIFILLP